MRIKILSAVCLTILLAVAAFVFVKLPRTQTQNDYSQTGTNSSKIFRESKYKFSFSYPADTRCIIEPLQGNIGDETLMLQFGQIFIGARPENLEEFNTYITDRSTGALSSDEIVLSVNRDIVLGGQKAIEIVSKRDFPYAPELHQVLTWRSGNSYWLNLLYDPQAPSANLNCDEVEVYEMIQESFRFE